MKKYIKIIVSDSTVEVSCVGNLKDLCSYVGTGLDALLSKLPDEDKKPFVKALIFGLLCSCKSSGSEESSNESDSEPLTVTELFNALSDKKFASEFFENSDLLFYLYKNVDGKDEFISVYHNSAEEIIKYGNLIVDDRFGPNEDMFMYNPRGIRIYVKED